MNDTLNAGPLSFLAQMGEAKVELQTHYVRLIREVA